MNCNFVLGLNIILENFLCYFSDYLILEGKAAMYKRGYHIFRRKLKKVIAEKKIMKKELTRLRNLMQLEEDLLFSLEF